MAAITFHQVQTSPTAPALACDTCGCLVPSGDRERAAHSEWHREREEIVVDLTQIKLAVA